PGHRARPPATVLGARDRPFDGDLDAVLALVEPAGPACHTGERTCFHTGDLEPPAPHEALPALGRTLAGRDAQRPARAAPASRARPTSRCLRWSARCPPAPRSAPPGPTPSSCWPTRRGSARR